MAGSTARYNLPLISGGSDDPDPNEVADARQINDIAKAVDGFLGLAICTSATRPSTPKEGQIIYETDTGTLKFWNGAAWATLINVSAAVPAGVMFASAATTVPAGYFVCDGTSLLRASYQTLFNAISTTYGSVDATHFNLPNLKGRVPVGMDDAQAEFNVRGEVGGTKTHTLTVAELAAHSHGAPTGTGTLGAPYEVPLGRLDQQQTGYDYIGSAPTQNAGGGQPHNNLQPYMAVNYIIKY